jgi:hypothetical protein
MRLIRVTAALPLLLIILTLAPAAQADSPAGDLVDLATYEIVTTYKSGDETFVRTTPGLIGVPALVNVNRSALSVPDLAVLVTAVPAPGIVSANITKLALPITPLPVKVELIFDLPGEADQRLVTGYDTLDSTAPANFNATATFQLGLPLVVDVRTTITGPGSSLALTGAIGGRNADGTLADPKRARIHYTPVPKRGQLRLELDELADEDTIDVRAETESEQPVTGVIDASSVDGDSEQTLSTTVVGLPSALDVGLDLPKDKDAGRLDFDYVAAERAESITARGTKKVAGAIQLDARATVTGMSRELHLVKQGKNTVVLDTDEPITQADVAVAKDAEARYAEPGEVPAGFEHFAIAEDGDPDDLVQDGIDAARARVLGLRHAEFDFGDPIVVDVELAPGSFFARAERGAEPIEARVSDLPARARVELRKPSVDPVFSGTRVTELDYTGTDATDRPATIGQIVVNVTEPDGFPGALGRANQLRALVRGLPSGVRFFSDASLRSDDKLVDLTAGGQRVDSAEVTISDGSLLQQGERLDVGVDGVVMRDLPDRFILFARVTGLRQVKFEQKALDLTTGESDIKDVVLDATSRRRFEIDIKRRPGDELEFLEVDVARLAPSTSVRLAKLDGGVRVSYTAPVQVSSTDEPDLHFNTNLGGLELVAGDVDPLPAGTTEMCFAKSMTCIGDKASTCFRDEDEDQICVGSGATFSAGFRAPRPVSAVVFVCEERLDGAVCAPGQEKVKFTDVRLTAVENLQFKFLSHKGEGHGDFYLNTEDTAKDGKEVLTGTIERHEPNVIFDGNVDVDIDAKFGPDLWAKDRFVRIDRALAAVVGEKFGEVECGETNLEVSVSPASANLTDRLCDD